MFGNGKYSEELRAKLETITEKLGENPSPRDITDAYIDLKAFSKDANFQDKSAAHRPLLILKKVFYTKAAETAYAKYCDNEKKFEALSALRELLKHFEVTNLAERQVSSNIHSRLLGLKFALTKPKSASQ